ncbi:MAG: 2-oxoglutarate dehydrogenase E1 component [bacterium]
MAQEPNLENLAFVETLWEQFREDPETVSDEWREYFRELEQSGIRHEEDTPTIVVGRRQLVDNVRPHGESCRVCGRTVAMSALQHRVSQLIRNYRVRGHRLARVNPLDEERPEFPELELSTYGFVDEDLDLLFNAGSLSAGGPLSLREIVRRLDATYCGAIGVQFMHIDELVARQWLQHRMESSLNRYRMSREQQLRVLARLTDAVFFEQFVQRKFVGAKSFSLEGAESLIPLLDLAVETAGRHGIDEVVIGMPHRGRLNVLANILGKHPLLIFDEFRDRDAETFIGRGDVKYHLGYLREWTTLEGRKLHLALSFNPSHLEVVSPVALGWMRAKMDRMGDLERERGLVILIHGDAAIAGEGIVQETLNLSELEGYRVGGALHVVVNNQIGFTTSPEQGRSSTYATDVAKMLQSPIFHVNGENPEAVAQVVDLALEFRRDFRRDVVIDMYCYRRRGHNEGDEPGFTQPLMTRVIQQRATVRDTYLRHLLELGEVTESDGGAIERASMEKLERAFQDTNAEHRLTVPDRPAAIGSLWKTYRGGPESEVGELDIAPPKERLARLLERQCEVPEGFRLHPKIERLLEQRRQMARGEKPLDWGAGEALALATLAAEGTRIRFSGQDTERGTFSHRHAVLHDYETGERYMPLANLSAVQGPVEILNSPLSESGVLGFEYGYSLACPDGLILWEAQFGDFANVAQVYIDQFIAAGEQKWQILSGIVLLLPHGQEGTGPEHASARLERFLSLAASDNYQVINPTTPAQIFHALRRQVIRPWRKPLIVMSPKSLLRHRAAVSTLDELATGRFRRILPDDTVPPSEVCAVLLCSGKIYYELLAEREKRGIEGVAIVRIEQLYPLAPERLMKALERYEHARDVIWVQEEPANMGARNHIHLKYGGVLRERFRFDEIARPESASPATGSAASHRLEQQRLLDAAYERATGAKSTTTGE